ncbi:peptidase, S41 family [Sphingobacterium spiritivorum ATCC 33300]|uniref:Tricorn protease homolog n=1 Tax=Sphingobacterium spiritivorum ATCC 33300 TaxID=525372 RepID=C2G1T5_SPHSI|nr:S41 family peptidase [Sphingobacterium spiritivorum]EEI90994.1 peptidase, S41 family [Sphingobacterium spiritivorum ATCC 33300]QQS97870.1 PD40 domain-containing protein [Sphingobacterium spiritivorum]
MIKHFLCSLGISLGSLLTVHAQSQASFFSYPTLSPDGQTIVFSYDGDLWKVAADGGLALRLTAMSGTEIAPRISPDGKWLAFSSNQNGNMDVYIMPLEGGDIRQLTYHDAGDEVDSWSWDSKSIYFTSSRYNRFSSYKVAVNGGTAERMFPHYFNTIHNVVETPSGELLFNDSWESNFASNRKRYKGAFNPDILSYSPKQKQFKQYTDYAGKDFWPSVDQKGAIFFASDEVNGEYNLYSFVNGKKTGLTKFPTSIKRPAVSANGTKVVFEKDYQLFLYDVATKKTIQPKIAISRNLVLNKQQEFDVKDNISNVDVSPDGKKMAFVSRGELFVSDIEGKFVRQMPGQGERIVEVKWLKDNKTLLFNQTYQGYLNWFTIAADGKEQAKQLTKDLRNNRIIEFNKDRTLGVYLSGRDEVRTLDLNTLKSSTVVKDEIWAFQNSSPSFSPDGNYILFTAYRNFEQDIMLHNLKTNSTVNLTNTGVSELTPTWSPDGKYIYFASNRTKPSYPTGVQNASIYRMALENFDEDYRISKFDELFKETEKVKKDTTAQKKTPADKDKKEPAKTASADKPVVTIDTQGLLDRITLVSPAFGTQLDPVVFQKGDKTYVFYSSNHGEGRGALYRTVIEPFTSNKTEKVADGGVGTLFETGGKYYALSRGAIQKYNIDANKFDKVDVSLKFQRNLEKEFSQMFYETWAGIEENFYDGTFHGIDWSAVKKQYEAYLPNINNRADLRILLNDMLGELNASHLGFNSSGPEERKSFTAVTNEIGVVYDTKDPWKVSQIIVNSPASRKGIDIKEGDILLAVNGQSIDKTRDRDSYFTLPSLAEEMALTFSRQGKEINVNIRPQPANAQREQLYDEWIKANRAKVDGMSNNRIAYSHMKNMGGDELNRFLLDMAEQENNKDAIILDLRYNTGGNVHDEVLRFLSQRPYLQWQYRDGKRAPQSNFAPAAKPIVLLINEQSLSDAEMTAAGFKALKLGKIIGTETYRWIIFTSAKGLVDGSMYRVPAWGCYTLDGQDLELTGVSPDIYVKNTFTDRLEGKDPQLEKAIQEILKDLK